MPRSLLMTLFFVISLFASSEKVFVRNLTSTTINSAQCTSLSNLFASELKHFSNWDIVTYEDVASMLAQELDKELLDCDNESCMQQIAGALGAPLMVSGDITKVGSYFIVNISLLHTAEGRSVKKVSERSKSIDGLIEIFGLMAQRLAGKESQGRTAGATGTLTTEEAHYSFNMTKKHIVHFKSTPPGAVILVDNKLVTASSPGQQTLTPGTYHVQMSKELYHDWQGTVTVTKNGQVVLGNLKPAFGYLTMHTRPENIPVKIDDSLIGVTPINQRQLSEGVHAIVLGGDCHLTQKVSVQITSGATKRVDLSMEQRMAGITIEAIDSSTGMAIIANVVIDGENNGTTPFSSAIPLCSKIISIQHKNHASKQVIVDLKEGEMSIHQVILGKKPKETRRATQKSHSTESKNQWSFPGKVRTGIALGYTGKFGNRYSGHGLQLEMTIPFSTTTAWYLGYSRTFKNSYTTKAKQQILDGYYDYSDTTTYTTDDVKLDGTTREFIMGIGIQYIMVYAGMFWESYDSNFSSYSFSGVDLDYEDSVLGFSLGIRIAIPLGKKLGLTTSAGYGWSNYLETKFFSTSALLEFYL